LFWLNTDLHQKQCDELPALCTKSSIEIESSRKTGLGPRWSLPAIRVGLPALAVKSRLLSAPRPADVAYLSGFLQYYLYGKYEEVQAHAKQNASEPREEG
jgi:hypothetical protein